MAYGPSLIELCTFMLHKPLTLSVNPIKSYHTLHHITT